MSDRASPLELLRLLAAAGYVDGNVVLHADDVRADVEAIDLDAESPPGRLVSV